MASDARPPAAIDSIPGMSEEAGRKFINRSRDVSAAFSTSCILGRCRFPPVARVLAPPGCSPGADRRAADQTIANFEERAKII